MSWSLLTGTGAPPCPGDADAIGQFVERLRRDASAAESIRAKMTRSQDGIAGTWRGPAAAEWLRGVKAWSDQLDVFANGQRAAADALRRYESALRKLQDAAHALLSQADRAAANRRAYEARLAGLDPAMADHEGVAAELRQHIAYWERKLAVLRSKAEELHRDQMSAARTLRTQMLEILPRARYRGPSGDSGFFDQLRTVLDITGFIDNVASLPDIVRGLYEPGMAALASIGMKMSAKGSDAWKYFRGAKGGFTRWAKAGVGRFPWTTVALEGTSVAIAIRETGSAGSSESAAAIVEGGVAVGASWLGGPAGGFLVEYVSKPVANWVYYDTPIGEHLEDAFFKEEDQSLDQLFQTSEEALARGDYQTAIADSSRAQRVAEDMRAKSEGWSGMWNATKNVLNPTNWF